MSEKKAFHEQVAEKLIKQLEAGTAPWQKPWQPGEQTGFIRSTQQLVIGIRGSTPFS